MSVLVAGGGPAGAAAALLLARSGRRVTVFERERESAHKVCGEFLGGDALAGLARLGIEPERLGARRITRLRLVHASGTTEAALPFAAAGLSRRRLDAALLDAAQDAGATVLRGQAVRARHPDGRLDVAGVGKLDAAPLFLATGKHDLRGAPRATRHTAATVGFKLHLRLSCAQAAALGDAIELLVLRDTYAGLQPIEDGLANLCLLTPQARLSASGGGWDGLLAALCRESPHLARRLDGAAGWVRPLAIARVPYGFVHDPAPGEGDIWRLGDQMGVIHSFTGDGIAIALHTAQLAAECFLAGGSAAAYHRAARADVRGPIRLASGLYRAGRLRVLQAAMMGVARLWPGVLGHIAGSTRAGWSTA